MNRSNRRSKTKIKIKNNIKFTTVRSSEHSKLPRGKSAWWISVSVQSANPGGSEIELLSSVFSIVNSCNFSRADFTGDQHRFLFSQLANFESTFFLWNLYYWFYAFKFSVRKVVSFFLKSNLFYNLIHQSFYISKKKNLKH